MFNVHTSASVFLHCYALDEMRVTLSELVVIVETFAGVLKMSDT